MVGRLSSEMVYLHTNFWPVRHARRSPLAASAAADALYHLCLHSRVLQSTAAANIWPSDSRGRLEAAHKQHQQQTAHSLPHSAAHSPLCHLTLTSHLSMSHDKPSIADAPASKRAKYEVSPIEGFTAPDDWPGPGPIELRSADLPHDSADTEWWYVNGHVTDDKSGDEYSFFASFFRICKALHKDGRLSEHNETTQPARARAA